MLHPKPRPHTPGSVPINPWRQVFFPEKYTVAPIPYKRMGGRDVVTGRKIVEGIGGGYKYKYLWIDWLRDGPESGPPKVEKVIQIIFDGNRSARVALVAHDDFMHYYLATEHMAPGQLITTSREIPKNPVQPVEGNAHPLGALPEGTLVNNIERTPKTGSRYIQAGGSSAKIIRQLADSTVLKMPSKHEFTFDKHCLAVVGRMSNPDHSKQKYAGIYEWREDGHRPRSGLYQKKDGRFGRKIKSPLQIVIKDFEPPKKQYNLNLRGWPNPSNDRYYDL